MSSSGLQPFCTTTICTFYKRMCVTCTETCFSFPSPRLLCFIVLLTFKSCKNTLKLRVAWNGLLPQGFIDELLPQSEFHNTAIYFRTFRRQVFRLFPFSVQSRLIFSIWTLIFMSTFFSACTIEFFHMADVSDQR